VDAGEVSRLVTGNHRFRSWSADHRLGGLLFALALLALGCPLAHGQADSGAQLPRSPFVSVSRQVRTSVVNIRTVRSVTRGGVDINPLQEMFRRFFPGGEQGQSERFELPGTGSGFVVSDEGHILTNHHVIAQADAVFVRFTGEQREYSAEVLGVDPNTDLALLKIEPDRPVTPLPFGDSDAIEVGDWAIAIGNPFGNLEGSLTVGVVSAKGRSDLVIAGGTPRYQDFLQTDASINFGNSGGPLVDISGRVIGVNTAVNTGGQGISFAIPSKLAQRIYQQLLTEGRVIRGYLGVRTEPVGTDDDAAGAPVTGARVIAVVEGSPAAAAGLQEGDVIESFAGQRLESPPQLQFLVAEATVGEEVSCVVRRQGRQLVVTVVVGEFAGEEGRDERTRRGPWLGMEVASLGNVQDPRVQELKEALGLEAATGVLVTKVVPGEPAAAAGIQPGDVLVTIDGYEIIDLETYRLVASTLAGRSEPIQILARTGTLENYRLVQPRRRGLEQ